MTMVQREQLDLMATFMHEYVGGAAHAMTSEIGDLCLSMVEQGTELRSSMARHRAAKSLEFGGAARRAAREHGGAGRQNRS